MKAALVLTVLTLNAAGPRRVHQGWQSRRAALVSALEAEKADVAAFQELWRSDDVAALGEAAGFKSWTSDLALGLAVYSRGAHGPWSRADLGWGGGALRARVAAGGREADVYSVRFTPGPESAARRLAQAVALSEFVRAESTGAYVLLGDLAAAPEDRETELLLDLLGLRDLCVAHGDETCGRTLDDRRVDYALIPYASKPPTETARAAFTQAAASEDGERPLAAHFGLAARLDEAWTRSSGAREPDGRLEALAEAAERLDEARARAEALEQEAGRTPWLGSLRLLAAREEALRLSAAAERARTALSRSAKPAPRLYE